MPLIGRDCFDQLVLAVTQSASQQGKEVNHISQHSAFKEKIALQFPGLISCSEDQKNRVANSKFHRHFQPRHQKGESIPINLQDKVFIELEKNYLLKNT